MYCPKCGCEYREGFLKCSDCGIFLVPDPPQRAATKKKVKDPLTGKGQFVLVLRTGRLWEVEMVANAFEEARIPCYQRSETSGGLELAKQLAPSMGPGEWWAFYVPKSCKQKAEKVLAGLPIEVTTNPGMWHFNPSKEGKGFFKNYALFTLIAILVSFIVYIIRVFRE
jgi:hypothetical protein